MERLRATDNSRSAGNGGAGRPLIGAPKPDPDHEALAGLVEQVTFHNPENGFCVLRVKLRGQRDLVTVVGHAAMISAGEFVQASGSWVNDKVGGSSPSGRAIISRV